MIPITTINTQEDLQKLLDENQNLIIGGHLLINISIYVKGSIKARGSIEAGWSIEARGSIEAGEYIKAGEYVFSFRYEIKCTKLMTSRLPFWREYYAQLPGLERWGEIISNKESCWAQIQESLKPDAKEIINAYPFHPLIKCQVEMFLGLKTEHVF